VITATLVAIWFGWILAGASPGPATLGIIGTSLESGRKSGLAFAFGILAGSAAWGLAAALGLSAIMLANAWIFEIVRYAGVAYLLWLAIKALKSAWQGDGATNETPFSGDARSLFLKGAAVHITNPKAILSWGAICAIVAPADASLLNLLGYFGLLYLGSIIVFLGYAVLFSSQRAARIYARSKRWFNLAFAGFFAFASVKILTAELR